MKYDIVLSGVGGQGVLSLSTIIAFCAMKEQLNVKQAEVHGMSQRGGSVFSHLRLSDKTIESDLVSFGSASMILSMEPIESLRYLQYLAPDGVLVTAKNPMINISNYPKEEEYLSAIKKLKKAIVIDADELAKVAGSSLSTNMVMIGAASKYLPLKVEELKNAIKSRFASKGDRVVEINLKAFDLGREAAH